MAKIIDITDKLNFEEKPQIKIKDTLITVNDEASAMLTIMPLVSKEVTPEVIARICDTIFSSTEQKKLDDMHLSFNDYVQVVLSAITLVSGSDESGEAVTPAMT